MVKTEYRHPYPISYPLGTLDNFAEAELVEVRAAQQLAVVRLGAEAVGLDYSHHHQSLHHYPRARLAFAFDQQ